MKTYKHKKLWWLAEECSTTYSIKDNRWFHYYIAKELIENSNDRELQEEKDWIDKMFDDDLVCVDFEAGSDIELIRKHLEKHMPKITKEELDKCFDAKDIMYLIEDKWLLDK